MDHTVVYYVLLSRHCCMAVLNSQPLECGKVSHMASLPQMQVVSADHLHESGMLINTGKLA